MHSHTESVTPQNGIHTPEQDIRLFRAEWARAVERLRLEKLDLLALVQETGRDRDNRVALQLLEIELDQAMFEMCIDRANEREEHIEAHPNFEREQRRERFFHLMAALARSGNEMKDDSLRVGFVSEDVNDKDAWSGERWTNEVRTAALSARHKLVGTPD